MTVIAGVRDAILCNGTDRGTAMFFFIRDCKENVKN
jgi:hypothetical protein